MKLSTKQLAAIDDHLIADNIIAAIREYRGFTGTELVDAKRFIDGRLKQLRWEQPLQLPTTLSPPTLDPRIRRQIAPLLERDLGAFRSTLTQIEELLYGYNYAVTLSANAATLATSNLPIKELMSVLYPESTPHNAMIRQVSSEELGAEIRECFTYDGDTSSGPQFTADRLAQLSETLLPDYWQQLNALVPLDSSSIYSYSSDAGLPGYYVFWFFAYLIHHSDSGRCVVITGMSSD